MSNYTRTDLAHPLNMNYISEPNSEIGAYAGQGATKEDNISKDSVGGTYRAEFFTYPLIFNIAGGAALMTSQSINIQNDADFIISQMQYVFFENANPVVQYDARPLPLAIRIQLTDGGSNATLINEPVPLVGLFGQGDLPFILPVPKRVRGASTFRVSLDSNQINIPNDSTLTLNFTGEKRYYFDLPHGT